MWDGHAHSSTNTFIYLSPPLCMQRRRYSLCGIHAAGLLKHAVVGWSLHHADDEGVWCHSLLGKLTSASASLAAQITPNFSMMPMQELHSMQDVEHTLG